MVVVVSRQRHCFVFLYARRCLHILCML